MRPSIPDHTSSLLRVGSSDFPPPPERRTFHDWLQELRRRTGEEITVRDFDGAARADFHRACEETPMMEPEFQHRLGRCTFSVKLPVEAR